MTFNKDVVEAIGNTPLIKLRQASDATGCTILGKAEFMNPGQSVKDRAGKWMILEAEKRAELVEVPALPYSNPNNFQHVGRRLADQLRKKEPNGVLFADQWNNLDNAKAHYESTGPEIWRDTGGKLDGVICSVGTGGTLAGVSRYLKEKHKDLVIACADPH